MPLDVRLKKKRRFSLQLDHRSRLSRLREIQAKSPLQTTINIEQVGEAHTNDEIPVEGPFSKYLDDIGYFTIYDAFNERNIVIAHRKLGENASFRTQHNIQHCIDLRRTRDDSYLMLTAGEKKKIYGYVMAVVLQIADAPGNVCIYCIMGRSRSPAFVAAYLVVVCCYSTAAAYSVLSAIFIDARKDARGIDRDRRFWPYVLRLESEVASSSFTS
jgi:hypothetical protein